MWGTVSWTEVIWLVFAGPGFLTALLWVVPIARSDVVITQKNSDFAGAMTRMFVAQRRRIEQGKVAALAAFSVMAVVALFTPSAVGYATTPSPLALVSGLGLAAISAALVLESALYIRERRHIATDYYIYRGVSLQYLNEPQNVGPHFIPESNTQAQGGN